MCMMEADSNWAKRLRSISCFCAFLDVDDGWNPVFTGHGAKFIGYRIAHYSFRNHKYLWMFIDFLYRFNTTLYVCKLAFTTQCTTSTTSLIHFLLRSNYAKADKAKDKLARPHIENSYAKEEDESSVWTSTSLDHSKS